MSRCQACLSLRHNVELYFRNDKYTDTSNRGLIFMCDGCHKTFSFWNGPLSNQTDSYTKIVKRSNE